MNETEALQDSPPDIQIFVMLKVNAALRRLPRLPKAVQQRLGISRRLDRALEDQRPRRAPGDAIGRQRFIERVAGILPVDDRRMKQVEAIILSMTKQERQRPELINGRRRMRISKGSGTSMAAVNNLLRQFGQMRQLMRKKGKLAQLMKQFGGGGGGMPFGFGPR